MSTLARVSLSIEQPLLDKLERLVKRSGYSNRSEYVRDMIRDRLVEAEWGDDHDVVGTVTLIYDHHAHGLSDRLTHLQHHHHNEVLAATHVHLDEHLCAEMILLRGRAKHLRALADQIRQQKGVLHAELSMSSTGKQLA
mgnify:CR=1 FL=1